MLSKNNNSGKNLNNKKSKKLNQHSGGSGSSQYKYLHRSIEIMKKNQLEDSLKKVHKLIGDLLKNKKKRILTIINNYIEIYGIPKKYSIQVLIGVYLLYYNFIGYLRSHKNKKSSKSKVDITLINIYQLLLGLSFVRIVTDNYKHKSFNKLLIKLGVSLNDYIDKGNLQMDDINLLIFNNILEYLYIVYYYVLDSLGILINYSYPQTYYKNVSFDSNSDGKPIKSFQITLKPPIPFLTEWSKHISKINKRFRSNKGKFDRLQTYYSLIHKKMSGFDGSIINLKQRLDKIFILMDKLKKKSEETDRSNIRTIGSTELSFIILSMHKEAYKAYFYFRDLKGNQELKGQKEEEILILIGGFFKHYFKIYDSVLISKTETKDIIDLFYDIDFRITDKGNPYYDLFNSIDSTNIKNIGRIVDETNKIFNDKYVQKVKK